MPYFQGRYDMKPIQKWAIWQAKKKKKKKKKIEVGEEQKKKTGVRTFIISNKIPAKTYIILYSYKCDKDIV